MQSYGDAGAGCSGKSMTRGELIDETESNPKSVRTEYMMPRVTSSPTSCFRSFIFQFLSRSTETEPMSVAARGAVAGGMGGCGGAMVVRFHSLDTGFSFCVQPY
eukprot:4589899-Prymnesium_polylepis.3